MRTAFGRAWTAKRMEPAENNRMNRERSGAAQTLDEKKPAAVSGLNPYQEETWRRQEPLYTAA
ncbi:hypothetical protein PUN4_760062 [Paraburkholderia unamae]|nr:hypothetical protein PUN4_760062 [Paraburkholderia unamae]